MPKLTSDPPTNEASRSCRFPGTLALFLRRELCRLDLVAPYPFSPLTCLIAACGPVLLLLALCRLEFETWSPKCAVILEL